MLIWAVVLTVAAVMAFFPETDAARWLRHALIKAPYTFLSKQKPAKVIAWTLIIGLALVILSHEPQLAMALAGAGDLTPFVAGLIDGSVALEIMVAVWLALSSGAAKGAWRLIQRGRTAAQVVARRIGPRARSRKTGATKAKPKNPADPEPGWGYALAA